MRLMKPPGGLTWQRKSRKSQQVMIAATLPSCMLMPAQPMKPQAMLWPDVTLLISRLMDALQPRAAAHLCKDLRQRGL